MEYRGHTVRLADDGTPDTVIEVDSKEYRFASDWAARYRDDMGALSQEGLEELADEVIDYG